MFTFERMRQAIKDTDVMFSSTEIDLIKQTEKNLKKVGVKKHERIVLYFTPALSVVANSIDGKAEVSEGEW